MADFETAYKKYIVPFEGGYVNHPADKGGETYAGIARNKFPHWRGWDFIDFQKKTTYKNSVIPRNTFFNELNALVYDFYFERWRSYHMDAIKSQKIANLLYDYIIHSGGTKAIAAIQSIVGADTDGIIGPETIGKINTSNEATTYRRLVDEREKFLKYLIQKDPSQKVFESGWMKRINTFKKLIPVSDRLPGHVALLIAFAISVFFFFLK